MSGVEVLVPLIFFVFLGAVIICPIWLKERTKQSSHRLISQAIERGERIDPDLIARLSDAPARQQPDRARRTLGSAVIMLALAVGLGVAGYNHGDFDPTGHSWGGMMIGASILGALGIAFLVLAIVDYMSKPKDQQQPRNPGEA